MNRVTRGGPARPPPVPNVRGLGRWLRIAQAFWVIGAVLALGILLASIPSYLLVARHGKLAGRVVSAPTGLVRARPGWGAGLVRLRTGVRSPRWAALLAQTE
jgi:hypothetical protein